MIKVQYLANIVSAMMAILGLLSISSVSLYILILTASSWVPTLILSSPALFVFYLIYKHTPVPIPLLLQRRVYIWDAIFTVLGWLIPAVEWKHMNWGYAALNENGHSIELRPEDENERFPIQYAHFVGTCLGTLNNLEGKTLLEVSSGRGGALSYYSRYLNPHKCIGVDLSEAQVELCNKTYAHDRKLVFYHGNALALSEIQQIQDEFIDVVVNIDSAHCYPNFRKFVQEVHKILVPGGVFLYSDFRPIEDWARIEKDLESCFEIKKKMNISQNVIQALKLDEERKLKLMKGVTGPCIFLA